MRRRLCALIIMHARRGPSSAPSSGSPATAHRFGSAVLFSASPGAARRVAPKRHSLNPALLECPRSFLPHAAEWGPGTSAEKMQLRRGKGRARGPSPVSRRAHSVAGIAGGHEHALPPQRRLLEEDLPPCGIRCRRVSDPASGCGPRGRVGGVCHAQHRCHRNSDRLRSAASRRVFSVAEDQPPAVASTSSAVDARLPRSLR